MNSSPFRLLGKLAAPSVLAAFVFGLPQAHAAGPFEFEGNQFYNPTGTVSVDSENGNLSTSGSGLAVWIYDTTPDAVGTNFFSSVSVDFDFSLGSNNSSVGIYFGGTDRAGQTAALAILNINSSGTTDTIRFSSLANCVMNTGNSGNPSSLVAGNTASGYLIGANYHANLTVTYLTATTMQATFTISDPSLVLSSFSATSGVYTVGGPGEIGFRSSAITSAANTFDNIAIPEPSTWALFSGAGALGLALVLRRKRR